MKKIKFEIYIYHLYDYLNQNTDTICILIFNTI
jgi:hypothetical protein